MAIHHSILNVWFCICAINGNILSSRAAVDVSVALSSARETISSSCWCLLCWNPFYFLYANNLASVVIDDRWLARARRALNWYLKVCTYCKISFALTPCLYDALFSLSLTPPLAFITRSRIILCTINLWSSHSKTAAAAARIFFSLLINLQSLFA